MALGDYMNADCHACIGGTNVREDMKKLESGVHVVVGTPGRVFDMINRGAFKVDALRMFILDEADEMLSRGFKTQIYDIFQHLPPTTQVVLLSATMPDEVLEVVSSSVVVGCRFELCLMVVVVVMVDAQLHDQPHSHLGEA